LRVADDRFRYGSAGELLSLAIDHNSLARYSKRTHACCAFEALVHSCRLLLFGFRVFLDLVRGSFQLSLTLLLRYRSQVVFTVGSICLPDSRAISNARYSGYQALRCWISPTGVSPSMREVFHLIRLSSSCNFPGPTTPHFRSLSGRIRFAVFRVRSPLLTESRLISCPPLTKMLQFGGCPLVTECRDSEVPAGSPIRLSRFQRLLATTPGISRLGATFIGS
jgi:hypothetical protein